MANGREKVGEENSRGGRRQPITGVDAAWLGEPRPSREISQHGPERTLVLLCLSCNVSVSMSMVPIQELHVLNPESAGQGTGKSLNRTCKSGFRVQQFFGC